MPMSLERLDPARGQAVAADLLAREDRLLQDDDVETGAGAATRRRWSPRGPGADDHDVGPALVPGQRRRQSRHRHDAPLPDSPSTL